MWQAVKKLDIEADPPQKEVGDPQTETKKSQKKKTEACFDLGPIAEGLSCDLESRHSSDDEESSRNRERGEGVTRAKPTKINPGL